MPRASDFTIKYEASTNCGRIVAGGDALPLEVKVVRCEGTIIMILVTLALQKRAGC
jgi:hypothetical protein